jgi:ribosomal protein S18 acetylase RimI-like enzyme
MNEKPPHERSEEFETTITQVTVENSKILELLRQEIDGESNTSPGPKFTQELSQYQEGIDHRAFLIKEGETAIGYVELDLHEDYIPKGANEEKCEVLKNYAHIARIGLLSEYRGKGIGKTLLKYAEGIARESGSEAIWLDYLPEKEHLVEFYESAGYRIFEEFPDGDKKRLRRIVLKEL